MLVCTGLAIVVVILKVGEKCSTRPYKNNIFQVLIFDTEEEEGSFQPLEQQKNDNKKYNGLGFIPDYDGYIS